MEKTRHTLLELTGMIGKAIAGSFPGSYWLVAEINEVRENINGHCYLELVEKDGETDNIVARCRATIWAYTWRMLKPYFETSTSRQLAKGMMILVEVTVEYHELYGISLNIKEIDPVYTIGDLERNRKEIIRRLEEEGIFNMNRQLVIPGLPSRIAVISSPAAAGYEDFIHQIENNSNDYRINVTLFPALMQGNSAGRSVTDALDAVFEQEHMFDVVVILRGGGSASDLSCFDSYEIAAHIAQFPLPVITGIGHERDQTIAGMVANTNVKTPTAVAEFILDKFGQAETRLASMGNRLAAGVSRLIHQNRQITASLSEGLPRIVKNRIQQAKANLVASGSILARSAGSYTDKKRHTLDAMHYRFGFHSGNYLQKMKRRMNDIHNLLLPQKTIRFIRTRSEGLRLLATKARLQDPENILKKGYALVLKNSLIVKSARNISSGDLLETKLHDGRITSRVSDIEFSTKTTKPPE